MSNQVQILLISSGPIPLFIFCQNACSLLQTERFGFVQDITQLDVSMEIQGWPDGLGKDEARGREVVVLNDISNKTNKLSFAQKKKVWVAW